ncbi:unnamed protein product, partial [Symbiodinium sp. CCMP2592]
YTPLRQTPTPTAEVVATALGCDWWKRPSAVTWFTPLVLPEEPLLSTRGDEVFAAEAQFVFDVLLCSTGGTCKVEHDVAGQFVEDLVAAAGRPDRHVDCKGPSVLGFAKSRQARPRPKRCHKVRRLC